MKRVTLEQLKTVMAHLPPNPRIVASGNFAAPHAVLRVLDEQVRLLHEELRTTTQRVNLFEKVKIPESRANIKRITVYLGDQQVAAVVRGKISKKNLEKAREAAV